MKYLPNSIEHVTVFSLEALRVIYFYSVNSIVPQGIIFWDTSSESEVIFKIKKKNN